MILEGQGCTTQTPDPHCQSLEVWVTLDHTLDPEVAPVWATIMNMLVSDSQRGSGDLQVCLSHCFV